MTVDFTPRSYRHRRGEKVLQRISHSSYHIPPYHYRHGVSNASFVFFTFEHGYKYEKGRISIDPCRDEHHLSVCLDPSPDFGHHLDQGENIYYVVCIEKVTSFMGI